MLALLQGVAVGSGIGSLDDVVRAADLLQQPRVRRIAHGRGGGVLLGLGCVGIMPHESLEYVLVAVLR